MYISPFWCGAISTVLVEIALIALLFIRHELKKKQKNP